MGHQPSRPQQPLLSGALSCAELPPLSPNSALRCTQSLLLFLLCIDTSFLFPPLLASSFAAQSSSKRLQSRRVYSTALSRDRVTASFFLLPFAVLPLAHSADAHVWTNMNDLDTGIEDVSPEQTSQRLEERTDTNHEKTTTAEHDEPTASAC